MRRRRATSVTLALAAILVTGTGIAWASGITLTSQKLGAAPVTTPPMFPDAITFTNAGGGVGKPANNDRFTLVWSRLIDSSTLCSGWTGTTAPPSLVFEWSVVDNGTGNDTLLPTDTSPTCVGGLHAGSINLGAAGYNTKATQPIAFQNTTNVLSYSATTTTLTVTLLHSSGGTAGTVATGAAATWTQESGFPVKDRSGNNCPACQAKTTTTVQF